MKPLVSIKALKEFGPGIVTGAADDDPSGVATYTITGAQFGYRFLWTALFTWPLMASVQMMCAHIALSTRESLTHSLRKKFRPSIVFILIAGLFVANTLNVAADLAAMADALELLTHQKSFFYIIAIGVFITGFMIFLTYRQIARALTWLTFFLFSYVVTAMKTDSNWSEVLTGTFSVHFPTQKEEWAVIVALLGTTISPYLFFWQATQEIEEMKEKSERNLVVDCEAIRKVRKWDILFGTLVGNAVMFFVILTAANSLNRNHVTHIVTTKQAAQALEPLLGKSAELFYTLGLFGVGLMAIPTLSGSAAFAMADFFKWESGLQRKWYEAKAFYAFIVVSMILAIIINLSKINPISALFYSSILNGLLSPVLIVAAFLVAADRVIMKGKPIGLFAKVLVNITALLMALAAIGMFVFT